ncbi:MAG TPA: GGDEF domain-containing protein [bacterium]|nr:GGDEF domain-containing protein [bacterium]
MKEKARSKKADAKRKSPARSTPPSPTEGGDEEVFEKTVVTAIEKVEMPRDEKAFILFISGPLMGKMYLLENESTMIGRADDVDISIPDSKISRHHMRLSQRGGDIILEDMGSTNGTFVNGERVKSRALESNDKVHLSSDTLFRFAIGDEADRMFQEEMHQMANYDAITGVLNKHALLKRLQEEFSYAKRTGSPLSLLMIDIDFFKKTNDTYGHMAGDYVLSGVADRIKGGIRDEDILARYGGEEFVVMLRGIKREGALLMAERIRSLVAAKPFKFEKHDIPSTISLGIATLDGDGFESAEKMISHADACLYRSKESGRNRVTA